MPAALNIDLRLALYELAQFNCFTTGGPMEIALFDEQVNYIVFKLLVEDEETSCSAGHLELCGLKNGASRGDYRVVYWEEDRFDTIIPKLQPFLDIKTKERVKDVLSARTHFMGQPIKLKQ